MLQCPKCSANLIPEEHPGVSGDTCAGCGGLWLDRPRLDTYVRNYVTASGFAKTPAVLLASPSTPTSLPCPRCRPQTLERVKFRGIDVEQCPTCQRVFLDRGDIERIAERTLRAIEQSTLPTARAYGQRPIAQGDWRSRAVLRHSWSKSRISERKQCASIVARHAVGCDLTLASSTR